MELFPKIDYLNNPRDSGCLLKLDEGKMKFLKKLIFFTVTLLAVNYFFAHISFNSIMHKQAALLFPQDSSVKFSSYFSFFPSPSIYFNDVHYQDKSKSIVKAKQLQMIINSQLLIKNRELNVSELKAEQLFFSLTKNNFDSLLKSIMFHIMRGSLGVLKSSDHPMKKFKIKSVILERVDGTTKEKFFIKGINYQLDSVDGIQACFPSHAKAKDFYQRFLGQYLIVASVKKACIVFAKAKKALPINMEKA